MLEDHEFCDACPGCRPALLDALTGRPLPDSDPAPAAMNSVWATQTTYEQRRAYIAVTVQNSQLPGDLELCGEVMRLFHAELDAP